MQLCPLCKKKIDNELLQCGFCEININPFLIKIKEKLNDEDFKRLSKPAFIGEGGFSKVYRFFDEYDNKFVAVKFLNEDYINDPKIVSLFNREVSLLPGNNSANLVSNYWSHIEYPKIYSVMEYVEGIDLNMWMKEMKIISLQEFKLIIKQICSALNFIHHSGFVHCDLKPSNIIINPSTLELKIMDFGLAHESGNEYILKKNEKAGTPNYMSPEQKTGNKKLFSTCDIYSLGVIAYELLTGNIVQKKDKIIPPGNLYEFWNKKNNSIHGKLKKKIDELVSDLLAEIDLREKNALNIINELERIIFFDCNVKINREKGLKKRRVLNVKENTDIYSLTTIEEFEEETALTSLSEDTNITIIKIDETKINLIPEKKSKKITNEFPAAKIIITKDSLYVPGEERKIIINNNLSLDFVWCPPGNFIMGNNKGKGESPAHVVEINEGFWLGQFQVTQLQWMRIMKDNPSIFRGALLPVENLSWQDCQKFLLKLNSFTDKMNFRLPSEAEWEYAARASSTTNFYWGDYLDDDYCWHLQNSRGRIQPVGMKKPNKWKLHDMCGNILEWCMDWYHEDYYEKDCSLNPLGPPEGKIKVRRGGGWFCYGELCKVTDRFRHNENSEYFLSSLRVLMKER